MWLKPARFWDLVICLQALVFASKPWSRLAPGAGEVRPATAPLVYPDMTVAPLLIQFTAGPGWRFGAGGTL